MDLEKQVVSLELAKNLKELGVKQESLFDWMEIDDNDWIIMAKKYPERISENEDIISAFTVSELGEMLPKRILGKRTYYHIYSSHWENGWLIDARSPRQGFNTSKHRKVADTEADARAKMLIYLLKNKLLILKK